MSHLALCLLVVGQPAAEPDPLAIRPAPLAADREERTMAASVTDTCVGGGGRFLFLHHAAVRKLSVFDVNEAKVVRTIAVGSTKAAFAAGLHWLFVADPDAGTLTRYGLPDFEKQATAKLTLPGTVRVLATGAAAAGPVLALYDMNDRAGSSRVTLLDPVTLDAMEYTPSPRTREPGYLMSTSAGTGCQFRASPDGTVFGSWDTRDMQSMYGITVTGGAVRVRRMRGAGAVLPADDNTLVTAAGFFTPECVPLPGDDTTTPYRLRVPAVTEPMHLALIR